MSALTPREQETLVLISKGLTAPQAGKHMKCAVSTVRDFRKRIYRKLNVSSTAEAAVIATKAGLV